MKFINSYKKMKKNPVVKELIPLVVPLFQKGLESEAKYGRTNINIINRIVNILESMEQIYSSIELLGQDDEDMQYHIKYSIYLIEDILFRLTSIFDKCLHLSNTVYATNVQMKECEKNTITKEKTKETLTELNRFTHDFRVKRKRIASSTCFSEPELDRIQAVFFLFKGAPELHEEQLDASKKQLKNYVSLKKEKFLKKTIELEQLVNNFFSSMLPEIKSIIISKVHTEHTDTLA